MKKKVFVMILGAILTTGLFTGCKGENKENKEGVYHIGISQFAEHGSLDNCREGFLEGLKEEGIEEGKNLEIDLDNANSDTATAAQISDKFVSDKVDLICAIATPSAQAAYNSAANTEIPVVYTAVTNPEEAELAGEDKTPVGNVTGTSDQLPVEAQLKMIREMLPDAKTIGILYTTSEANSVHSIKEYEKYAKEYGFTLETAGVTNTSEVSLAAAGLLEKVNKKGIPVFGSEIEQVKLGCLAAEGLDYINLGKETGKMAAKILKGEAKAEEMSYELLEGSSLYINEKAAENLKIELPEELKNRAEEVFTEIEG